MIGRTDQANGSSTGMSVNFRELRTKMVDGQLRTTDVTDLTVLQAFLDVPRETFVEPRQRELAYIDEDIRISDAPARYMMEPSPLAKLIQLAEIRSGDFVLDVGAGTGYASAILSRLAGSVIALESDPSLAERATSTLSALGSDNVVVVAGPLAAGVPKQAPFDVIFVNGAVDEIPETLSSQLRDGGRLVAVIGHGNAGVARVFIKVPGGISARTAFNAAVKPLPGFEKAAAFVF